MAEKDGLDVQQVQIDKERWEQDQANLQAGLRHIMSVPTGRAWMWDLLGRCGMFASSVNLDIRNPTEFTFFREGNRNMATMIWDELQGECLEETLTMQREGMQAQATRTAVDSKRGKKRRRKKNRSNARGDDDVSTE